LEAIPKPLYKRLVLTFLVGTGCFFTGLAFYLMEKDLSFLLLSTLVFFLSLCKTVLLFLQIVRKSYIMLEGICLGIHPMLFCNCNEIILEDMEGNSLRLMLGKNQKLHRGVYYQIYFKTPSGISPGKNPLMTKVMMTDNFLGMEPVEPPDTISGTHIQS